MIPLVKAVLAALATPISISSALEDCAVSTNFPLHLGFVENIS